MTVSLYEVTKIYQPGGKAIKALDDISLDIAAGDSVLIMGPSGSGKSTLLYIIGLLLDIDGGTRRLFDLKLGDLNAENSEKIRIERIGFIFQDFELIPKLTVEENISFPYLFSQKNFKRFPQRVDDLLKRFGLYDRGRHFPNELSVGERQRTAICRALINDPELIIADEPTANLDSIQGSKIMDDLLDLSVRRRKTFVVVSHDERIRDKFGRVFLLNDGKLSEPTDVTT